MVSVFGIVTIPIQSSGADAAEALALLCRLSFWMQPGCVFCGSGRRPVSFASCRGSSGGDISCQCLWTTCWACCVGCLRSCDVCLLIYLAPALGLPLSWRKLKLGARPRWIGWVNFTESLIVAPCAALPEEKRQRLLAARVCQRALENRLGMLCWFTAVSPSLRCWLRDTLCAFRKPVVVMRNWGRRAVLFGVGTFKGCCASSRKQDLGL